MRQLIGLGLVLLLGACGAEQSPSAGVPAKPPVEWNLQAKSVSQADAERALTILLQDCPKLGAGAGADVKRIRVKSTDEYADHRLARGWKTNFEVSVELQEALKTLPKFAEDGSALSGQTLGFNLGGGQQAGVMSGKRAAQALCGLPAGEGADTFKPIPALSFLGQAG